MMTLHALRAAGASLDSHIDSLVIKVITDTHDHADGFNENENDCQYHLWLRRYLTTPLTLPAKDVLKANIENTGNAEGTFK